MYTSLRASNLESIADTALFKSPINRSALEVSTLVVDDNEPSRTVSLNVEDSPLPTVEPLVVACAD